MNELAFPVAPANSNISYGASIQDPRPIGNGTYTSWPGGVDPSVPLYAGNPVPLSMNTTQSGGRRRNTRKNRMMYRKNRMVYRKNTRKASRKNRKNSRKNSRKNRKNSRKASRKNRKNSRKNNRRN